MSPSIHHFLFRVNSSLSYKLGWMRTNRLPYFSSKNGLIWGWAENCNLGSVMMMNNMQVPHSWVRREFVEKKSKFGKARVNPESMYSCWLSPLCWKKQPFFLLGSAVVSGCESYPHPTPTISGLPTLFNWAFYLLKFYSCKLMWSVFLDTVPSVFIASPTALFRVHLLQALPASGPFSVLLSACTTCLSCGQTVSSPVLTVLPVGLAQPHDTK